ncbi:MAG: hypothetical protein HOE90_03850 [Bacteriovoracaceae bacterium]|nr:hypothetical protein [Bacteriovoracaceae bacterium]
MDQSTPISIATTEVPQDAIFFLRLKKEPHFEGLPVVDWPENTISLSQGRAIKFLGDTSILKDQHGILQTWGVVKIHAKVQLEMKKQFIQEVTNSKAPPPAPAFGGGATEVMSFYELKILKLHQLIPSDILMQKTDDKGSDRLQPKVYLESRSKVIFPDSYENSEQFPKIHSLAEISQHNGQVVQLQGIYTQVDVGMMQLEQENFKGHVEIVLDDSEKSGVSLFQINDPLALRPIIEIEKFEGKKVIVIGNVYQELLPSSSSVAAPINPGISQVKALYIIQE